MAKKFKLDDEEYKDRKRNRESAKELRKQQRNVKQKSQSAWQDDE